MTTIQRVEFFSYELPKEVITSFLDERKKSLNTYLEGCKISISIHALNFAMIQRIDHLVTFVLESVSKEALNLSRTLTYALSPLHVAVILGRLDLVKQLVKAGMDVNLGDHRQWTSLHHAALSGRQEIIDFLNDEGADQKALTREEGTYRDIFRLTQPPFYKPDQKISLMWKEDKEEASQLSMGQFKEMTGAHYLEENYVSRPWMITRWKEGEQNR